MLNFHVSLGATLFTVACFIAASVAKSDEFLVLFASLILGIQVWEMRTSGVFKIRIIH
jgi:hypothetical protein